MPTPDFFINSTDVVGITITALVNNVTGSLFLALMMIVMLLFALCIAASIPIEWTIIFMLPLLIYLMAFSSEWLQVTGFALIYLGILFAKTYMANR